MILALKKIIERIPEPLASWVPWVPFSLRFGRPYAAACQAIETFDTYGADQKKTALFDRIATICRHAYHNTPFYRDFYTSNSFHPDDLSSFADINKIPIVTKSDFHKYGIEERSSNQPGRMLINTGGTSGEPLEFYIDRQAFAREWANMHRIWHKLSYRPTDRKLTFRGKNLGNSPFRYNAVHNEYLLNAYLDLETIAASLLPIACRKALRYLHGYPSSIYTFAEYCDRSAPELKNALNQSLRGILYASEFPAPVYREKIESIFPVPSVSWYGHSEMAILAYERNQPYRYEPLHTYGYCEAAPTTDGRSFRLIGTSCHNTASPFVRYDTGDLVRPIFKNGLLASFQIAEGRIGEFVTDARGHQISLTALIFGRHHPLFAKASFIQICQKHPGAAEVVVSLRSGIVETDIDWKNEFDGTAIDMTFKFRAIESPITTPTGKVPLLVTHEQLESID